MEYFLNKKNPIWFIYGPPVESLGKEKLQTIRTFLRTLMTLKLFESHLPVAVLLISAVLNF